jgi:hypothetical protein
MPGGENLGEPHADLDVISSLMDAKIQFTVLLARMNLRRISGFSLWCGKVRA